MSAPIFICGTGRCGTSWLQQVLSRHSRIFATRYEGRFAVAPNGLFEIRHEMLGLPIIKRFKSYILGPCYRKLYRQGTPREYYGGLYTDIEFEELEHLVSEYERQLRAGIDRATRTLLDGVYSSGMRKQGKSRWLEKTPRNLVYMKELRQLFPKCQFLHIIRDGRDVALSIVENFWPIGSNPLANIRFSDLPRTTKNAAGYWSCLLDTAFALSAELPSDAYMEVRFEDLVCEPEPTLRKICDFLGERFEERLLKVPPKTDRLHRWREQFTKQDKADFKREAGEMLIKVGYEQDDSW
ncbi:MAG: sulfotransferase [Planctomycetes bacterium]|nr:sulfotransferase [Planctomycetota bacterium]